MGPLPVQNPELLKDQLMKRSQSGCKQLLRILQIGFPLRNNKSKYRGLIKQKTWAYCRCLWINLIRILNFTKQICQRTFKTMEIPALEPFFSGYFNLQIRVQPILSRKFSIVLFLSIITNFNVLL